MKMEKFNYNVCARTLTITSEFSKKMSDPTSDEYQLVLQLQNDFPGLKIVKKTHRTPTSYTNKNGEKSKCNQFKNLTYERMEKFMSVLPQKEAYLTEYNFIKDYASVVQYNGYALVRKWFVAQFPEFRKNPMFYLNNTPTLVPAVQIVEEAELEKAGYLHLRSPFSEGAFKTDTTATVFVFNRKCR